MHLSRRGSSLASSSRFLEATWENALSYFRRSLMECGSSLSIEHSQRVGLLFSKRVGNTDELKKWASIFDAENVPTTALLLKALVNHNQWHTAMQLLELNRDIGTIKELSEVLAQSLTKIGLWQEALSLIAVLTQERGNENVYKAPHPANTTASLSTQNDNSDSFQMATNPAFLPEEEQTSYCGFAAAVAQGFPRRKDWEKAVAVLQKLQQLTDRKTQNRLFEYEVARLVYNGQRYQEVVERSRTDVRFRTSPSLLRSLLHCALAIGDAQLGMQCLELLCSIRPCAVSIKKFEAMCQLFISSDVNYSKEELGQFESVLSNNANIIQRPEIKNAVAIFCADYELRMPEFVRENGGTSITDGKPRLFATAKSVTQLDRVATTLLVKGRWKDVLQIAEQIRSHAPQSDAERIITEMLRGSSNSWEKTLQFFTN